MDDDDDDDGYWAQTYPEVLRMGSKWRDPPREVVSITKTDDGFIIETKEKE